ncbi:MAG: nucleotidyl transferase AbiEii/AbiGii toxin family protein [Raoultibacter sp.]
MTGSYVGYSVVMSLLFRFVDAVPVDISQDYREGYTVVFEVWLGGTKRIELVSIDLVVDATQPDDYEVLIPVNRLDVEGVKMFNYITNTPEKRIAEKVCATMQTYGNGPSSRVKDLVDLIVSMRGEEVDADKLACIISAECKLRRIPPFDNFSVPDNWKVNLSTNYKKLAYEAQLPAEYSEVDVAEVMIRNWIAPAINAEAAGCRWKPDAQRWF